MKTMTEYDSLFFSFSRVICHAFSEVPTPRFVVVAVKCTIVEKEATDVN